METRKKKKIDYSEMLGGEEEYYGKPEKTPPQTTIKGRKRKSENITSTSKACKSSKKEQKFEDFEVTANWEEIVVKEELLNSDSDDFQSEDEDIEKQMEDASDFLQMTYQHFIPTKPVSKKLYTDDIKLPIDIYSTKNAKVGDKCSLINYVQGYLKILLNGHIYFCNRVVDNIFHWQCDQNRDCISQAVTMFNDDKHSIKSLDEHNHPPTVNENCCLKDNTIAMFLPAGIRQNSFEKCDVKKNQHLIRNGYFYVRRKTEGDIDFWLCEHNKSEGCKGGILTILYEDEYYVKYASEHNHVNDLERQYRCHYNEEELQSNKISNNSINSDYQPEATDTDINYDALDFDNDHNDPDEPDYEVESDQENDDQIFIKKEVISEDEDIKNDLDTSREEPAEIICDFINSQRGNPKLCINGYMYTLNRKSKSSYWTCEFKKKKSIACMAMACTTEKSDGKHIVKKMTEHNHPPRTDRKIIGQILNRIREKCIERIDLTASEVVESEIDSLPEELRKALPSQNAIYRMISRKRRLQEAALGGSKIYERKEVKKLKTDLDVETSLEVKDAIICQTVEASRGNNKLIIDDYLFNLSRVAGDNFYWRCEQRLSQKCVGFAITRCENSVHYLKNIREHNHESQRNRKFVVQAMNTIKERALKTDEDATVIVEDALNGVSEEVLRELPTKETLIRKVNRTRYLYKPKPAVEEPTNKDEPNDEKSHIYDIGIELGTACELFSPTNKGNFKLNLNGYFYHKNRINNGMHYWQCEDNKHYKCKGFAVTVCTDDVQHILKKAKKHNHPAKESRQDIAQIIQKIKEKAKTSDEDSSLIYNDEIEHLPDEIKNLLPQRCSILSMINRIRKQHCDGEDKKEPIKYDDEHEHIFEIKQLPDTECEFVESKRGFEKLTIEGKHFVKKMTEHNHPPRTDRKEIEQILNRIREKCIERIDLTVNEILESEVDSLPEELRKALPSQSAIYRMISRKRRLQETILGGSKIYERKDVKNLKSDFDLETSFKMKDEIVCQIVESSCGNNKLIVDDYLFNLSRVARDNFYWRCEQRLSQKCIGFAVTCLKNGVHYLKNIREHNHESQSKRKFVVQAVNTTKEMALKTDADASIIVEDALKCISEDVLSELPTKETLIRKVNRTRYLYKPKPAVEESTNKYEPIDEKSHVYDVGVELGTSCELFSPTNKGNFKLNLNGYFYHKNRVNSGVHYWACEYVKNKKCKAFCVTSCTDDDKHILKKVKKHNHPARESRQDITQIIQKIKEKAKTSDEDPSLIYNDEIENLPDEIKNLLPQRCSILSMINRFRKQYCDADDKKELVRYDDGHAHIFEIKHLADTKCELIKSNKGFEKLQIEGYLYCRDAYYKELQIWMCMERKKGVYRNCRGYAQTYKQTNGKHYLKKAKNHNHPPNKYHIELCHLMNRMKDRVLREAKTHCTQIYDEETANCQSDLLECLPLRDSVINTLNRYRRKFNRKKQEKCKIFDSKITHNSENEIDTTKEESNINEHVHYPFVESGTDVEIIMNHKGVKKLNLNGYLLVKRSSKNNSIYWVCQQHRKKQCFGNAITAEENGRHILKSTTPHNHIACDTEIPQITEIMKQMKEQARISDESVGKIYDNNVGNLPKDLLTKLPNKEAVKQVLKRFRLKHRVLDKASIETPNNNPGISEKEREKIKEKSTKNEHIHYPFVESGTDVQITINHRGVKKLNLNGYLLVKKSSKNSSVYWVCQQNRRNQCLGSAITEEENGRHILKSTKPHNHIACDIEIPQITEIMKQMKEQARISDESVARIYDNNVRNLPKDLLTKLPNKEAVKQVLKRFRSKYRPVDKSAIETPNNPPEVEEILQRMKKRIITTLEGPSKVYNEEIINVPPHLLVIMPKREKILDSLKWQKRKTKKHQQTN